MSLKILLADDSMTAQNMGKKILVEAGYEVVAVSNGQAVLKKMPEVAPDILVLDIYMPGYSGLEVSERIKNAPETAAKPVLLTVGKLEPYQPEEVAKARADGIIIKPFEATDLLAAVEKLAAKLPTRPTPPPAPVVQAPVVVEPEPEPVPHEVTEAAAVMASAVEESAKEATPMPAIAPEFDPALSHFGSLPDGFPLEPSPEIAPQPTVTEAWHNASVISLDFSTPTAAAVATTEAPVASIPADLGAIAAEFADPAVAPMFIADIPEETQQAPSSSAVILETEEPAIDVPPFVLEEAVAATASPVKSTEALTEVETASATETGTIIEPEELGTPIEVAPAEEHQLESVAEIIPVVAEDESQVAEFEPKVTEIVPVEEPAIDAPVAEEVGVVSTQEAPITEEVTELESLGATESDPELEEVISDAEVVSVENASHEEEHATESPIEEAAAPFVPIVIPDPSEDFTGTIDLASDWPLVPAMNTPGTVENTPQAAENTFEVAEENSQTEEASLETQEVSEIDPLLDSKEESIEVEPVHEVIQSIELDSPAIIEPEPVEVVREELLENQDDVPETHEDRPVTTEASLIQHEDEEQPAAQVLEVLSADELLENVPDIDVLEEQAQAPNEPALSEEAVAEPVSEPVIEPAVELPLAQELEALLAEEPVEEPAALESPFEATEEPEEEKPGPTIEHSLAHELESLVGESFTSGHEIALPIAEVHPEPTFETAEGTAETAMADISANRVGDVVQRVFDRYKTQMIEDIVRELAKHE